MMYDATASIGTWTRRSCGSDACRIHFGADGSVEEGGRERGDGRRKQDLNRGRFESFVAVRELHVCSDVFIVR